MSSQESAQTYLVTLSSTLQAAGNTAAAAQAEAITTAFNNRYWYEMSVGLLSIIQEPLVLQKAYELHEKVLMQVRADISPIAYVKLVDYICFSPESNLERALALVEGACASLLGRDAKQANYAAQCIRALLLLEDTSEDYGALAATPGSGPHTARHLLDEVETYTHSLQMHEVEPLLIALHCKARGREYELRRRYTRYYTNAFDVVTYADKAEMPIADHEMNVLAVKTAIAALLSEEILNFGKLLNSSAFVTRLSSTTEMTWLLELINLCNEGDVEGFNAFFDTHAAEIQNTPELAGATAQLQRKVRLMALLHLVFYTPFSERTFTFKAVANRCVVAEDVVETLLLTALAQGIVRGKIDGLRKEVHITWVEPRVLSLKEVKELSRHVATWRAQVSSISSFVSETAEKIPK